MSTDPTRTPGRALPVLPVLGLEPPRILHDRLRGGRHVSLARGPVEELDLLERVARRADADRLLHDAIEIDEDLRGEQRVELSLARAVRAHEPTQRGYLVRGVVKDVHRRIRREARVHPVEKLLERALLPRAIVRPEILEQRSAVLDVRRAEEVLEPALGEREALHVEVDIARRDRWNHGEPDARDLSDGHDDLVERRGGSDRGVLQSRLSAQPLEDDVVHLGNAPSRRCGERRERRDPRVREAPNLVARDPRHAARVVHAIEDGVGVRLPTSMIGARLGDRLLVGIEAALRLEKLLLERRKVEEVVVRPKRDALAGAVHDGDALRPHALQMLEHLRVRAELEQEVRLRVARELRIGDLVAEGAELRRPRDAVKEIGIAREVPMAERALVDDVAPGAHRLERRAMPGLEVAELARRLPHVASRSTQRRDVALLVRDPHRSEQRHLRAGGAGRHRAGTFDAVAIHPRSERALEEARDVARREDERVAAPLHLGGLFLGTLPSRRHSRPDRPNGARDWTRLRARPVFSDVQARDRFARPGAAGCSPMRQAAKAARGMRFVRDGALGGTLVEMPREDALDLLEWLGLERPEFGAIEARALAPLCRRRLWPMPRNLDAAVVAFDSRGCASERRSAGTLCRWTLRLLQLAEQGDGDSVVAFG